MLKQSARKPSQDPNKESLLRKKDELKNNISAFNSKIKELKKDLHQFKKLMQTPLSKPIPENSAAYLGKLTSQFNEAANLFSQIPAKSNQIIQHQAALPKPLQAKASLMVTASSRVSRLLTRLKNLSSDDPESADRMSLLIICEELYYDLEKLQAYIVEFESSPQSIYSADALFNKLESNVKLIKGIVSRYESKEKKEEVSTLPTKKPLKDKVDEGKSELVKKCEEIIEKYLDNKSKYSESDREQVELLLFKFYGDYSEESAANLINKIKSLKPISQQEKLESTAQVGLKKWFGKARHSVSQYLSDKTSNFRLKIYNLAEEMRQELDEMMNSLESDMDASEISKKEKDLSEKLSRMKAEMLLLRSVLTGVSLSEDYVKMLRQKHLTDYDVELTSKQEEQIKNLMQSRRMRELANISNYRSTLRDKTIK